MPKRKEPSFELKDTRIVKRHKINPPAKITQKIARKGFNIGKIFEHEDMLLQTLSFLNVTEYRNCCFVSKTWKSKIKYLYLQRPFSLTFWEIFLSNFFMEGRLLKINENPVDDFYRLQVLEIVGGILEDEYLIEHRKNKPELPEPKLNKDDYIEEKKSYWKVLLLLPHLIDIEKKSLDVANDLIITKDTIFRSTSTLYGVYAAEIVGERDAFPGENYEHLAKDIEVSFGVNNRFTEDLFKFVAELLEEIGLFHPVHLFAHRIIRHDDSPQILCFKNGSNRRFFCETTLNFDIPPIPRFHLSYLDEDI